MLWQAAEKPCFMAARFETLAAVNALRAFTLSMRASY